MDDMIFVIVVFPILGGGFTRGFTRFMLVIHSLFLM